MISKLHDQTVRLLLGMCRHMAIVKLDVRPPRVLVTRVIRPQCLDRWMIISVHDIGRHKRSSRTPGLSDGQGSRSRFREVDGVEGIHPIAYSDGVRADQRLPPSRGTRIKFDFEIPIAIDPWPADSFPGDFRTPDGARNSSRKRTGRCCN